MRFPDDVPELTDGVAALRAHRADDIEAVFEHCQDASMQRWTTIPVPYERGDAERFVTKTVPEGWVAETSRCWAIEYDGRYAGSISIRGGEAAGGEIGFAVAPWARGNEVATRAARLLIEHAFSAWGWDVVVWHAMVGNWASRRVAWRLGFTGFSTARRAKIWRDEHVDVWTAALLRDEPREPRGRWLDTPVLTGERVALRPVRDHDLDMIAEHWRDARTRHFLPHFRESYTREEAEEFVERSREQAANGQRITWSIAERETGRGVGTLTMFRLEHDDGCAEVGYAVHPKARGNGYVTDALRTLIPYALGPDPSDPDGLRLRTLLIKTAATNQAARRAAEQAGFTMAGRLRQVSALLDGTIDDDVIYDLVRDDLKAAT
ncbi:MAG: GNAT family N-acetyltransferase [Propionibacteriales bacterium]|nr:GNAT family N-acetyltransferase [Propionibacteriales bacterium]